MAVYSGKGGSVTGYADVTKWSASVKASATSVVTDRSNGWKASFPGAYEVSGQFEALGHSAPTVGQSVALVLSTGLKTLSGQALITEVSYEVDIEGGGLVRFKASFVSNGAWTV